MIHRLTPLLFAAVVSAQTNPNLSKVVETYCSGCHNGTMRSPSNQLLDQFDASNIAAHPEVWARAYRQLQAGAMPPFGAPRPNRATYEVALKSIEQELGGTAAEKLKNEEIATRVASLLWNSAPDAALLNAKLSDPATLESQVRRMLADDRAQTFVSRFFFQWLQLDHLAKDEPEKKLFPNYDPSLRDSFEKETELFLLSQLRDDRDPVEVWSANYTYLNDQLANYYGVPNVSGSQFRRVNLSAPERAGLLGQGSVLMVTSRPDSAYTSPATRGKWIRMHYLNIGPPNPFPNAQPVKPELPITPQTRVLADNPCVTCHRNFFPLGYALENFDALGHWRTNDQAGPVDASGKFVDGSSTNGIVELRQVLLQRPDAFRTAITEALLSYAASGKAAVVNGTPETLVRARKILSGERNPRWSTIIAAVVESKPVAIK